MITDQIVDSQQQILTMAANVNNTDQLVSVCMHLALHKYTYTYIHKYVFPITAKNSSYVKEPH